MIEEKIEIVMRSITFKDSELEDYYILNHLEIERNIPIKFRQLIDNLLYSKEVFYIEQSQFLSQDPDNLIIFYSWE